MKKVNEKLTQISTLATKSLVADAPSPSRRQEGSPTSTDSSTSTIKGDESVENIPALVKQALKGETEHKQLERLVKEKEGTDGRLDPETRARSRAVSKPSLLERRESEKKLLNLPKESAALDRKSCTLPRLHANRTTKVADVTALDPKTVESLEKFQRYKHRGRPHTPEPVSPDVTDTKILLSPAGERRLRRKSEGMPPIAPTIDTKSFKCSEPTVMEETVGTRAVTPTGRKYKTKKEREREAELLAKSMEACATPRQELVSEERTTKAAEKPPSPAPSPTSLRRREREGQASLSKEQSIRSDVTVTVTSDEVKERTRSPPVERQSPKPEREKRESGSSSRESSPFSRSLEVRKRQKSPISDRMKCVKSNRRKTPIISTDALDAILRGEIPDVEGEEDEEMEFESSESSPGNTRRTLDTITEQTSPPRVASPINSAFVPVRGSSERPKSPEKKVPITSALKDKSNGANGSRSGSPDKRDRRVTLSAEVTIRHKSTSDYSPERSPVRELSPSPENKPLLRSGNRTDRLSRLQRTRSMVMSRSTPDLTVLLEGHTKEPKKVERSNSRRRPRLDSYISYTSPNHSSEKFNNLTRSYTVSHNRGARFLSGSGINKAFSSFTRSKDRKRV